MASITLEPHNQQQLAQRMKDDVWVVACLCAAWCDVCTNYRPGFDELAAQHPDKLFVWIDIEDRADLIGDFDVCLLYTSPSPRDRQKSRMPSSA